MLQMVEWAGFIMIIRYIASFEPDFGRQFHLQCSSGKTVVEAKTDGVATLAVESGIAMPNSSK